MSQPANQTFSKPQADEKAFEDFLNAVKSGNFDAVKNFFEHYNNSVLSRLELIYRQPPLYFAITGSDDQKGCQMAKLLVSHGADPKFKDQNEQTVLYYACRDGKQQCCKYLLEQGLSVQEKDMYGQTPLYYIASQNRINLLDFFNNKDLLNHTDKLANQTALYYAARKGHTQMCKQLIARGLNPLITDAQNKTAADYAKKARHNETYEYLKEEIKKLKEPMMPPSGQYSQSANQKRKKKDNSAVLQAPRATYKIVFMNEKGQAKDLTQQQVRNLIKGNQELETYLADPSKIPTEQLQKMQANPTWQKVASKILQSVIKHKGAYWFMEPVDPVKYNILDYFDIVDKPMDLGTVKKKLSHNVYRNGNDFVQDMNLVWGNCIKYNGEQHQISKIAKDLGNYFEEQCKKYEFEKYLE